MKLLITLSTSRSVNGVSPGSGAVCSKASRSSATSTCPLSSSSKAEKADNNSLDGESEAKRLAIVLRKVGKGMVWDDPGGKKGDKSEEADGSPKSN